MAPVAVVMDMAIMGATEVDTIAPTLGHPMRPAPPPEQPRASLLILETYLSPNRTFLDLPALLKEMDLLSDFAQACRRELREPAQR